MKVPTRFSGSGFFCEKIFAQRREGHKEVSLFYAPLVALICPFAAPLCPYYTQTNKSIRARLFGEHYDTKGA